MSQRLPRPHLHWLLLVILTSTLLGACSREKRVTKALMRYDQNSSNHKRAWPYNYTYQEYAYELDNAKIRQEFYRKRKLQAQISDNKKTAEIMGNNIQKYQKKIDRLEDDKEFYRIYRLRSQEVDLKIKQAKRSQREIEKNDKNAKKAEKKKLKSFEKEQHKQNQNRNKDLKKNIAKEQEAIVNQNKNKDQKIQKLKNEIRRLQKALDKADEDDKSYYEDEIEFLKLDIEELQKQRSKHTK